MILFKINKILSLVFLDDLFEKCTNIVHNTPMTLKDIVGFFLTISFLLVCNKYAINHGPSHCSVSLKTHYTIATLQGFDAIF